MFEVVHAGQKETVHPPFSPFLNDFFSLMTALFSLFLQETALDDVIHS